MKILSKIVAGLCGVFLMFLAFVAGNEYGQRQSKQQYITATTQGTYRVYAMNTASDMRTGEPVYWVIGGKMTNPKLSSFDENIYKGSIEPSAISVIIMPRKMMQTEMHFRTEESALPDPTKNKWKLEVNNGKAWMVNEDPPRPPKK